MTTSPPAQTSARASTGKRLQIDVWSDLACPWCYIGKNRLDQAIASSPHAEAITVKVRSFELDPGMSQEAKPNLELLGAKYGVSPAEALRMENKVGAIAHHDGLPFTSDRMLANSFDAHRVLHLANTTGLADQLLGDLQRALFSGRANVYDHTVLADFAHRRGILRSRVEEVLSSNEYADVVSADEKEARTLGATGVPFTVFDGRIAIPGATSTEGFIKRDQPSMERQMNITEIIPTEISGYCDAGTGECITAETGTPHGTPTENAARRTRPFVVALSGCSSHDPFARETRAS